MKIMQVVLSLECGGLEKLVIGLSSELNKKGFKASILCLDKRGELAKEAESKGIKVLSMGKKPGFDFLLPFRLANVLRKEKIDFVHTHNFGPLIYGGLAARMAGIHAINTRHGREEKKASSCIWNLNRKIIAISEDARRELLRHNKIPSCKVRVIYNGISINSKINVNKAVNKRQELGLNPSDLVVGNVARLSEEKDHFTLIEAFFKVNKEMENTMLVIAGDGQLKDSLRLKVKSLKLEDKVLFLGFRDDAQELMYIFDVFTLSSTTEGVSLTLLEAMASEKPVVATNVGGNPEVVTDGVTGFLVPPKEPERMAEAIIRILSDRDMAKRMGEAGRKRVEEKFSLERMVKEYQEIYEDTKTHGLPFDKLRAGKVTLYHSLRSGTGQAR